MIGENYPSGGVNTVGAQRWKKNTWNLYVSQPYASVTVGKAAPLAKAFREGAMDLSDVQQQMSSGLNFGIMNALRTGNPILDVMVCMLIPVILSLFMGNSNSDPMSTKIKDSARFLTLGYSGLVQENAALKLKTAF